MIWLVEKFTKMTIIWSDVHFFTKGSVNKVIYSALDKVQFSRFCVIDFKLDRNSMSMRTRFQEAMSFNKD